MIIVFLQAELHEVTLAEIMNLNKIYFPLFFDLNAKPCLVVGGGKVALRKVKQLLEAGAQVTVIAPQIVEELEKLLEPKRCEWLNRIYISPEASAYHLVIATTDDADVNRKIYQDCAARNVPVNVVDQPNLCSVIFPSVVRRNVMTTAISSGGTIPFFTRFLRERLETFLDEIYYLEKPELLLRFRDFVQRRARGEQLKNRLYRRFLACDKKQWSQWSAENPPLKLWIKWLQEESA